jgi:pimeloyl-ACP methyl ester carboxylesterase
VIAARDGSVTLPDDRRLAYCDWGEPGRPPVLLLHGAPGSRRFHPNESATAEAGVRLVTFDRPGFGASDRFEGRSLLDTPTDVAALADYLGLDRFAVVGVSAGGPHALACAVALGDRVRRVAVASMPGPLDEVPGAWAALPERIRIAAERARVDPARAVRGVVRYMQGYAAEPAIYLDGGPPADRAVIGDPRWREMLLADVAEALRAGAEGFADDMVALWRPWGFQLDEVPAGVRIWHGAQDTRGAADFECLRARLPGARATVWADQGHYGAVPGWSELLASDSAATC